MGVVASLVMGRLYDRIGIGVVVVAVCLSALFSPLVFIGGFWVALVGMFLWGIAYATQDTLLKALIASVLPEGRRNLAFGLFYLGYGGRLAGRQRDRGLALRALSHGSHCVLRRGATRVGAILRACGAHESAALEALPLRATHDEGSGHLRPPAPPAVRSAIARP